jgi:hypothetical protein
MLSREVPLALHFHQIPWISFVGEVPFRTALGKHHMD